MRKHLFLFLRMFKISAPGHAKKGICAVPFGCGKISLQGKIKNAIHEFY